MSYESALKCHYAEVHARLMRKDPADLPIASIPRRISKGVPKLTKVGDSWGQNSAFRVTKAPTEINLETLLEWVAQCEGIPSTLLRSTARGRSLRQQRFTFYHLAYKTGFYSTTAIGRYLPRDHSTIIHGILRLKQLRSVSAALEARLRQYEAMLEKALEKPKPLLCFHCPYRT